MVLIVFEISVNGFFYFLQAQGRARAYAALSGWGAVLRRDFPDSRPVIQGIRRMRGHTDRAPGAGRVGGGEPSLRPFIQ